MADRPVRQLRLLGRTRDGSALVMEAAGERFVLPVDDAVLAAMGAPLPEREDAQKLSPRTIQERIRRGESSASIAVDSGMEVTEVARFERPVIAERTHQADAAAATIIRGRSLLDRLLAHRQGAAEGLQLVPEPPRLDAWLAEDDGDWVVQSVWPGGEVAHWHWRPASGSLVPVDAVARLISDEPAGRRDDLEAVLRPLRSRPEPAPTDDSLDDRPPAGPALPTVPATTGPARNRRATVPTWEEITLGRPDPGR